MGDRTYHQIYVHDCPPAKAGTVLDILDEHGFSYHGAEDDLDGKGLVLGDLYAVEESSLGTTVNQCIPDLVEKVPEIVVDGWEDPKYEWMGEGAYHAPELGIFSYECGQGGEPLFTADAVLKVVEMGEEERNKFLGIPWTKVPTPDDGTVLPRPPEEDES